MINRTIARPKTNSRRGATVMANSGEAPTFIRNAVALLNTSFRTTIKIAPKMEPGMLPSPPMIIMAINSMDSPKLKGSGVILFVK